MTRPVPGQVLARRYRVERVLGQGGMGVVVEATHLQLGERVAVKILLREAAQVPELVARFRREARAALRLQSEYVARVMDVGVLEDGAPFMVMELLTGGDLAAELESGGPLPMEAALDAVLEAAAGVAEAHAVGVVHRDIKPSNLFRARLPSGRSVIKVLDFGIAKQLDEGTGGPSLTHTFSALGSAAYMSPEQVRAAKDVDERTDIWSLGVVLFELLTGSLPFVGESVTALAAAITADDPIAPTSLRPEIPAAVEHAILAALAKRPAQRTPSLVEFAGALAPYAGRPGRRATERVFELVGADELAPPAPLPQEGQPSEGAEVAAAATSVARAQPVRTQILSEPHGRVSTPAIAVVPAVVPHATPLPPTARATRQEWVTTLRKAAQLGVGAWIVGAAALVAGALVACALLVTLSRREARTTAGPLGPPLPVPATADASPDGEAPDGADRGQADGGADPSDASGPLDAGRDAGIRKGPSRDGEKRPPPPPSTRPPPVDPNVKI